MPTLQYNELLAKREVFQNEATMAAEDVNQRSEPEKQQVEHGPTYTKLCFGASR